VVELLTGLMFLLFYLLHNFSVLFFVNVIFASALIVISFIDLKHRIITDVISLPGIAVGLAFALVNPEVKVLYHLIAALLGGGFLWLVAEIYYRFTGKEGMGGGDIKLLAMIGAFVGIQGVLFTIFVSSVIGSVCGMLFIIFKGKNLKTAIPFGPFLAMGAFCYTVCGKALIQYYFFYLLKH
jgi:leader peptidase (prepilin peptidase)/N-methyltransferase